MVSLQNIHIYQTFIIFGLLKCAISQGWQSRFPSMSPPWGQLNGALGRDRFRPLDGASNDWRREFRQRRRQRLIERGWLPPPTAGSELSASGINQQPRNTDSFSNRFNFGFTRGSDQLALPSVPVSDLQSVNSGAANSLASLPPTIPFPDGLPSVLGADRFNPNPRLRNDRRPFLGERGIFGLGRGPFSGRRGPFSGRRGLMDGVSQLGDRLLRNRGFNMDLNINEMLGGGQRGITGLTDRGDVIITDPLTGARVREFGPTVPVKVIGTGFPVNDLVSIDDHNHDHSHGSEIQVLKPKIIHDVHNTAHIDKLNTPLGHNHVRLNSRKKGLNILDNRGHNHGLDTHGIHGASDVALLNHKLPASYISPINGMDPHAYELAISKLEKAIAENEVVTIKLEQDVKKLKLAGDPSFIKLDDTLAENKVIQVQLKHELSNVKREKKLKRKERKRLRRLNKIGNDQVAIIQDIHHPPHAVHLPPLPPPPPRKNPVRNLAKGLLLGGIGALLLGK